ncbi:MAG TPA: hypothetical protein VJ769_01265, partial [Actinomycetes bacterium]|nr:hypothetical protein [Actinomycetes bacterium]
MALLAWAVMVPGFAPAGALAAGRPPGMAGVTSTSAPSAAEGERLQIQAWQRGREAAAEAGPDRAAARRAAGGTGASATPAAWVVP